jgi:hypothetical protein
MGKRLLSLSPKSRQGIYISPPKTNGIDYTFSKGNLQRVLVIHHFQRGKYMNEFTGIPHLTFVANFMAIQNQSTTL